MCAFEFESYVWLGHLYFLSNKQQTLSVDHRLLTQCALLQENVFNGTPKEYEEKSLSTSTSAQNIPVHGGGNYMPVEKQERIWQVRLCSRQTSKDVELLKRDSPRNQTPKKIVKRKTARVRGREYESPIISQMLQMKSISVHLFDWCEQLTTSTDKGWYEICWDPHTAGRDPHVSPSENRTWSRLHKFNRISSRCTMQKSCTISITSKRLSKVDKQFKTRWSAPWTNTQTRSTRLTHILSRDTRCKQGRHAEEHQVL